MDGQIVRKQKCLKLADYGDHYRCPNDLDDLVAEKMANVRQAAKRPHSSDLFVTYVEEVYLPFVERTMKPSTYSGYRAYFERYVKPRAGKYALRDFTVAIVSDLLEDVANMHRLNNDTVGKVRSILSGIFTYAMGKGHFPGTSASDNPASRALIPEAVTEPKRTVASTRDEVQAIVAALKGKPLERAVVAIVALTSGSTKTEQSERFVTVTDKLREILLDLWKAQGSPLGGYILAGKRGQLVNLDNMAKRVIVPAIEKCSVCRESKADHKALGHPFERDKSLPQWHG